MVVAPSHPHGDRRRAHRRGRDRTRSTVRRRDMVVAIPRSADVRYWRGRSIPAASNPELRTRSASYATGFLAIAGSARPLSQPVPGRDGRDRAASCCPGDRWGLKTGQAITGRGSGTRTVTAINGVSNLVIALIGWWVWQKIGLEAAIGVAVGGYVVAAGWRMLVSPVAERKGTGAPAPANVHPYARLRLGPHKLFDAANAARRKARPPSRRPKCTGS